MAEINFDAVLVDALSAPLQAIADNLIKVSDAVTAMSQNLKDSFDANVAATEALTTSVDFATEYMDLLVESMDAVVASIDGNLVPSLDAATASMDGVAAAADNLAVAMDANTGSTEGNSIALDANTASIDALTAAVDTLTASLAALGVAQTTNNITTDNSVNSTVNYTTVINNNTRAVQQNARAQKDAAAAGAEGEEERSGGYGAILGATMLLGMAGAAVKVGIDLVKMGADGEAALNRVAAMTGASADEMTYYKGQIEALAPVAGKTVEDLSNGLYDVVSAGFKGAGAMNVLTYAAKAAAAGGTDLHTVTTGLTSIMKAFGMSSDDAGTATDILVQGVRMGRAPFADFSRAIGLVGVVSSEAGIKIGDATAALSTLTVVYPSVRQAGQGLQALIQDIGVGAGDLAKRADKMGLAFDENTFTHIPDLTGKLAYLQKITGGNGDEMKKLLNNSAALKAGLFLLGGGAQNFANNEQAMANVAGTTDAAFKTHTQTIKAHIEEMQGALSVLAIHISALAEPMVNAALSALSHMFTALATAFETHANIMKPLLIALAVLIGSTLVAAIIALMVILSKMTGEAMGIAGPIILVELAIAALVAIFIYAYKHSEPFRQSVNQLWDALKRLGQALAAGIIPLFQEGAKLVGDAAHAFGDLFGHMAPVQQSFDSFQMVTQNVNGHMVRMRQEVEGVKTVFVEVRGPLSFVVDGIRWFANEVNNLTNRVREFLPHATTTTETITTFSMATRVVNGHVIHFRQETEKFIPVVHHAGITLHQVGEKLHKIIKVVVPLLPLLLGLGAGFKVFGMLRAINLFHLIFLGSVIAKVERAVIRIINPFRAMSLAFHVARANGLGLVSALRAGFLTLILRLRLGLTALATSMWGVISPMLPFIAIAVAVAAVVALLVFAFIHWWKTSEEFRKIVHGVLDALADLGKTIVGQVHPIIKTLIDVWKHNLLPAIHQGQQLFITLKPVLLVIAGIITGMLLVAIAYLVGALKGVVLALSWVIQGAIRFAAGLIQTVVGVIKLVVDYIKGFFQIIIDIFSGPKGWKRILGDTQKLLGKLKADVGNIFHGLITMILGLLQGLPGAVFKLMSGFVTGFLGFFLHIFDKLVGHSIVPDMVMKIIWWIATLPLRLAEVGLKIIASVLGIFTHLLGEIPKIIGKVVGAIVGGFTALPGMLAGLVGKAATAVVNGLGNMAKGGLHKVGSFFGGIGNFFSGGHKHSKKTVDAMSKDVVNALDQMKKGGTHATAELSKLSIGQIRQMADELKKKIQDTKNPVVKAMLEMQLQGVKQMAILKAESLKHAADMKAGVTKNTLAMSLTAIGHIAKMAADSTKHVQQMKLEHIKHFIELHEVAVMKLTDMANKIKAQIKGTKDETVKHVLEMKLKSIEQLKIMHERAVAMAEVAAKKLEAIHTGQKDTIVNLHKLTTTGVVGALEKMAAGMAAKAKSIGDDSNTHFTHMHKQTLDTFDDMNVKATSKFHDLGSNITKAVSGIPGQATQWGSNIGNNLASGIASAKGAVGGAVQSIASEIAALIGFHSPTKKGPGSDADKWVPNLVNMMTSGFERGGGPMAAATAKFAQSIKNGILKGAGSGMGADGGILTSGARGGAPLALGAGNGIMNVTVKLEGGMGAGLALLNPTDRKRYVEQIGNEMAQQSRRQGRVENGYSGF